MRRQLLSIILVFISSYFCYNFQIIRLAWLGFVSLFNDMSTFVDNLIPKPCYVFLGVFYLVLFLFLFLLFFFWVFWGGIFVFCFVLFCFVLFSLSNKSSATQLFSLYYFTHLKVFHTSAASLLLDGLHSSSYFQVLQSLYQSFSTVPSTPIFANVSHQTRLDIRSKARRPIKVEIKGRGDRERAETRTLLVYAAHRLTWCNVSVMSQAVSRTQM